jgi:hypothetical protein
VRERESKIFARFAPGFAEPSIRMRQTGHCSDSPGCKDEREIGWCPRYSALIIFEIAEKK